MTRFYFSNNQRAPITTAIPPGWNLLGSASWWSLTTEKDPTDPVVPGSTIGPIPPNLFAADRVYVSDRLDAQLLSGTISLYLQTLESNADDNITSAVEVYVIDEFGAIRGVLIPRGHWGSSAEYATSYTNRAFLLDTPLAPITAERGDRLVIVIGHTVDITGVSSSASARYGSDVASADLAANESQTTLGVGFALFSATIRFADQPDGGTDHSGVDCIDDPAAPPDPHVPPTETPPPVPVYFPIEQDRPQTAIPHEGVEEFIHLIRVDGNVKDGFTYRVHKILSTDYQMLEWYYHRKGGCGTFRLLTRDQNFLVDFADRTAYAWELWVRIRLPGEAFYKTWYRGEIKSVTTEQASGEIMTDVRGVGYVEQLQSMYISRKFPGGMTVRQILEDILDEYVYPGTRIIRADLMDVTNQGLTESNYTTQGELHFECSVYRALKFLAELQGDIEWGIDSEARFFWKKELSVPGKAFFLPQDGNYTRAGAYNDLATKVRFEGSLQGGKELLRIINDVTDPTDPIQKQEYCRVMEHPWVAHPTDAQHWADNLLIVRRRMQHWRVVKWAEVTSRLEANHPVAGLRRVLYRDAVDVTNDFSEYEINRIRYIKGGVVKVQVYEKGRTKSGQDAKSSTLSAEVWLGAPPRGLGEELETLADDIDALKGKWKQYRAIPDVTTEQRLREEIRPRIPGELRFFTYDVTQLQDITKLDITNSIVNQIDPTNKPGLLVMYDGKQWVKQSPRRTFWPELPNRGFFAGELATLLSDITNNIGELYKWTGSVWEALTTGSVVDTTAFVRKDGTSDWDEHTVVPTAPATDKHKLYPHEDGFYHQNDLEEEVGPIRNAPPQERSIMAWQKAANKIARVLIGTGTDVTTEGTESQVLDSDGQWLNYANSGIVDSDAGWIQATQDYVARQDRFIFDAVVKTGSPTIGVAHRLWIGMADSDLMPNVDPLTRHVLAIRFDSVTDVTNFQAYSADGVASSTIDTGVAFANATKFHFRIDLNRLTGTAYFYINKKLVATKTLNLPGLTNLLGLQVQNRRRAVGGAQLIKIQKVAVEYNG